MANCGSPSNSVLLRTKMAFSTLDLATLISHCSVKFINHALVFMTWIFLSSPSSATYLLKSSGVAIWNWVINNAAALRWASPLSGWRRIDRSAGMNASDVRNCCRSPTYHSRDSRHALSQDDEPSTTSLTCVISRQTKSTSSIWSCMGSKKSGVALSSTFANKSAKINQLSSESKANFLSARSNISGTTYPYFRNSPRLRSGLSPCATLWL
mmetsp:Transcript_55578/g.169011  ORF Transcript_55578/g.169011 Transcript_55578/m.169011 type:complete len:211 (-) Transcript_55578:207-839(-)